MDIQIVITLFVVITMIVLFIVNRFKIYQVFLASVAILWLANIVSFQSIVEGFLSETTLMIAFLFPVAIVIQQSTNFEKIISRLLDNVQSYRQVIVRMMLPIALFSSFLNNTPLVMMMTPMINKWTKHSKIPASKLLIPLSYAAIVGGMCTLIGTATNLIVNSLMEQSGYASFHMFELSAVGIPIVLVTITYTALTGNRVLPNIHENLLNDHHTEPNNMINRKKQWLNMSLFLIMLLLVTLQYLTMFQAMFILLLIYLLNRSIRFKEAIRSVSWKLLTIVGSSSVLAAALTNSGTTDMIANWLVQNVTHQYLLLIIIYCLTNLLTEFISNYGAAAFVFPIALSLTTELSLNMLPFAVAITIAASASFSTPIGYQTNLLIYEKGGYRCTHFFKMGIGLNILVMITAIVLIPIFWSF